jgi:hypothetical protein
VTPATTPLFGTWPSNFAASLSDAFDEATNYAAPRQTESSIVGSDRQSGWRTRKRALDSYMRPSNGAMVYRRKGFA